MASKQELQKELKIIKEELKRKKKELRENKEYIALKRKKSRLEKEQEEFDAGQSEIEKEINLVYLDKEEGNPQYKTNDWDGRNIRQEVLNSIKRTLGITNLTILKPSEIEHLVKNLINSDLEKNKEYKELFEKSGKIGERIDEIEKGIEILEKPSDDLNNKIWQIERNIEERKREKAKDPSQKNKAEKEKRRREAREKFDGANLEEIRSGIKKEKIMNELEGDEDEDE